VSAQDILEEISWNLSLGRRFYFESPVNDVEGKKRSFQR
jgi:hypothetical protein